jgi:hypothetical protein
MAHVTKSRECYKEQSLDSASGGMGNGNDLHGLAGLSSGDVFRDMLRFETIPWDDWNVYRILDAWIELTTATHNGVGNGGSARLNGQRISGGSSWSETGGSENHWTTSPGGNSVYPGATPAGPTFDTGSGNISSSDDHDFRIYVREYVEAIAPSRVLRLNHDPGGAQTNQGVIVRSSNEGSTGARVVFYSRRIAAKSKRPRLVIVFDDDQPPDPPEILVPETTSSRSDTPIIVATAGGRELTTEFNFNDPDDTTCGQNELRVYADAATDATADGSAPYASTGPVPPTAAGTGRRYRQKLTGVPARTIMRFRQRVADPTGAWSPWTSVDAGRIQTAFLPGVPLQPGMTTNPDSAVITGTINSQDPGDYVRRWAGEFYRDNPDGSQSVLWTASASETDLGNNSSLRRSSVSYGGEPVKGGDKVRWRHKHWNRDLVEGAFSPFYVTTMVAQAGPTITPADTSTKLLSRGGPFTISASSFDAYQYRLYRGDIQVYDSGVVTMVAATSVSVTIPSGIANWGDTLGIEAATRPAGTAPLTDFCPRTFIYIDSLPTTTITPSDGAGNGGAVIGTLDILWSLPYNDPDRGNYGENPTSQELEIRAAASPAGSGALVIRRTSIAQISEDQRTGRTLHALAGTGGAGSVDANITKATYTATAPTGYSTSTSDEIQATGASSATRGWRNIMVQDLSDFSGGTLIKIQRRCTSVTNLTRWILRIFFATTSDLADFTIVAPADAINTWAEVVIAKADPVFTSGTVDWSNVTLFAFYVVPSGAYTGNLEVRDLRIGVTQTGKTVPDGDLVAESSYDARARYRDNATTKMATTLAASSIAGATNVKVASVTGMTVGDDITIIGAGFVSSFLETRTITVVGTAGGGGTGVTVSEGFTYAHTSGDNVGDYYWGPWTSWTTVKASVPPTVTAASPADRAIIADPTVDLVHTYSSPGGKVQDSRKVLIYRRLGYAYRVLAGDPESFWRLGEASGDVADSEGGITGTAIGGLTYGVTGPLSPGDTTTAITFDGTADYITATDIYDFPGVLPFSIGLWIKPNAYAGAGTSDRLLAKLATAGTTNGWELMLNETGLAKIQRTVAGVAAIATAVTAAALGSWTHVVGTYDGATLTIYVNGVAEATQADAGVLPGNASLVTIGRAAHAAGNYYDGTAGNVAIWARALPAGEVLALYGSAVEVPGDQAFYAETVAGAGLTDTLPTLLLADDTVYAWQKIAYDSDLLAGTTTRRVFTTAFTVPDPIAGLVGTSDDEAGSITLSWTPSADPYLDHYRVYWRDQTGQLLRIDGGPAAVDDGRTKLTDATFTFYGGRLGDNEFQVTAHDGSLESVGSTVDVTLGGMRPGSWEVNSDGEERYAFPFDPDSAPRSYGATVESFSPPGRRYPLHLHWGQGGRTFSLSMTYTPPEDGDLAQLWGELLDQGRPVSVKAPEGYTWDVIRARVVGVNDAPQASSMSCSVDFAEVDQG